MGTSNGTLTPFGTGGAAATPAATPGATPAAPGVAGLPQRMMNSVMGDPRMSDLYQKKSAKMGGAQQPSSMLPSLANVPQANNATQGFNSPVAPEQRQAMLRDMIMRARGGGGTGSTGGAAV